MFTPGFPLSDLSINLFIEREKEREREKEKRSNIFTLDGKRRQEKIQQNYYH